MIQHHAPDKLLDKKETADRLKVSVRTVDLWRSKGLPYIKMGGSIRFLPKDLDAYIQAEGWAHEGTTTKKPLAGANRQGADFRRRHFESSRKPKADKPKARGGLAWGRRMVQSCL